MKVEAVVFGAKWIVTTNCKLTLKKVYKYMANNY